MESDDAIALGFDYVQNTQMSGIPAQEILHGQCFPTNPEATTNTGYNIRQVYKNNTHCKGGIVGRSAVGTAICNELDDLGFDTRWR